MSTGNAILVGISGPSSSGKTTLARLLRDVLPNAFILHEDDFYKDDSQIPQHATGVADWDCLGALDLPSLESALRHIKTHGSPPPDFVSKEDKNSVGQVDVEHTVVDDLTWRASKWMFQNVPPVAIIDGFLLYSEDMKGIRDLFDVKLFLKTDFATTKQRRENRSGYVTLQGFWEDPPDYVPNVVWPNYVKDHAFLFHDGDVEGPYDEAKLAELQISGAPASTQKDMTRCLEWAYGVVEHALADFRESRD
ncbi:P-loop containing nucleoside triphosphate hydrolase protein [Hortaea werneckii]|nr:P-loop containing nucleoside triphosphate hydrolase protein [Hortaea werneckii]KAI6882969.1 P-loop containing nucleoside triphosphate hydrolase protein [Hortaea werneckii]KAI6985600.1 P-loop containing nucleoside triphosphate hydrolase protein [Hortaea werneckii]KAI7140107.1 P-loop containing nucleoside triphosphate hydrolase protein [Hortaea werneckii]KAI7172801.1 P-loop containing nucleoside triphosphate hydrolase protein [Hortaea werneckii]